MHFKTRQPAIFEPVDLVKGSIHPLRALKDEKLTHYLKMGVGGENIWRTLYAVDLIKQTLVEAWNRFGKGSR